MFLYYDESGNSGANLLDKEQPFFCSATIFSQKDLESKEFQEFHNSLLSKIELSEIHMNELNPKNRILILKALLKFIEDNNIDIFFSILDKKFTLKMAFFDFFFDSYLNPLVNPIEYEIRENRLPYALYISELLNDNNLIVFSKIITDNFKQNQKESQVKKLSILIRNIRKNLRFKDTKIKEVLRYVEKNSSIFLEYNLKHKKQLLPNSMDLVSIFQFINHNKISLDKFWLDKSTHRKGTSVNIDFIINNLIHSDKYSHRVDTEPIDVIDKNKILFNQSSKDSFGIQIADVFAWLFCKYNLDKLDNELESLLIPVLENSVKKHMNFHLTKNQIIEELKIAEIQ